MKSVLYRISYRSAALAALLCSATAVAGPVEDLVAGIQSDSVETRIETAMGAGAAGIEGLNAIEPYLTAENYVVKKAAFQSLDAIVVAAGQPGAEDLRKAVAKKLLAWAQPGQDDTVRLTAVRKLGFIGKDPVAEALGKLVDDEVAGPDVLMALERIPGGQASVALMRALDSPNPATQCRAAMALAKRDDRATIDAIKKLTASENEEVKWCALEALAELGVPPLQAFPLPADATPEQRKRYVQAALSSADVLARRGESDSAASIYAKILEHARNPSVIAYALTGLGDVKAPVSLRLALAYVGTPGLHHTAVQVLTDVDLADANEKLAKAYVNMASVQQAALLGILADRGAGEAKALAAEAAKSDDEALRFAAARALGQAPAFDDAIAVAKGGPFFLEADAVDALFTAAADDPAALRRLIQSDLAADLQKRAQQGLIAALVNQKGDGAVAALLEVGTESDDPEIVAGAAEGLAALGARPARLAQAKGFFTEWRVAGPFDNEGDAAVGTAPAELVGGEGSAAVAEGVPAVVNLRQLIAQSRNKAAVAETTIHATGPQKVYLYVGSDDGCEVWVNDELVHSSPASRGYQPDQDQVHVKLNNGPNKLAVKVFNNDGDWQFSVRARHEDGTAFDTSK